MAEAETRLSRDFYLRPTLEVARDLIGKVLVYKNRQCLSSAKLVEVEAYIGTDDPACHAAAGITKRNEVMFGPGGFSYIYFIYGMYHCLNIVTEHESFPAAILIRGAEPLDGVARMRKAYGDDGNNLMTNGPGKLCKAFGLTHRQNGLDLAKDHLYLEDRGFKAGRIASSVRIGISRGKDKQWRFFDSTSPYVSKKI